jgi:urease accessory protein
MIMRMPLSTASEESSVQQQNLTVVSGRESLREVLPQPGISCDKPLQAKLALEFAHIDGASRLVARDHFGPLLVQKPLYPEGREVCHTVIIHPPGGVVGGDQLEISAHVGAAAKVQITTPGAAKWYKANGHASHQKITLSAGQGAALEWVPQETIFFNNANVNIDHEVTLENDAVYVGCEILCFGRTASGETFNSGQVKQRTSIRRNGTMIWLEQIRLHGESTAMHGPLALSGKPVCATLLLAGKPVPQALIDLVREESADIVGDSGQVGISQLKSIIVVRYLGNSSEAARHIMLRAWGLFRPEILGRPAIVPRMWNT